MYDKDGAQRNLEASYVLTTAEGVEALLDHWQKFSVLPYERGDYDVVDLTIDAGHAIRQANLSTEEYTAIDLVCVQGYTQQEVATAEGVTQKTISVRIKTATQKIANVYLSWGKKEE